MSSSSRAGAEDDDEESKDAVDAMGRKMWDKDAAIEKAKANIMFGPERIGRRKDPVIPLPSSQRTFLKQRTQDLQLDKNLGKQGVVTQHTIKPMQGGYWCSVCECLLKDSSTWLEHINGRRHNRNLGMNMKVEKIGVDRVKEKLKALSKKPEEGLVLAMDIEARIAALEEEQEEKKRRKKDKKKKKKGGGGKDGKDGKAVDEDDDDDDVTGDEGEPAAKRPKKEGEGDEEDDDDGEGEETEEMKMLKAMGLPTGFG
mmetsp:Transcript_118790/g.378911  ORF Transcript_118790/g.378911 Transcript_118790/m.378911 type:complete len:256 (-) Transcript_118790:68-835(-)